MLVYFFYFGTQQVNAGLATYGGFAAFISIIMNSFSQLKNLTFAFDGLNQSMTALEIHLEILDKIKIMPKEESSNNDEFTKMQFIDFSSQINNHIYHKFNFELESGEKIFIVGKSGCGKSSFIKAMLGYINHEGNILYDNKLKEVNLFCWMPQEYLALEGTIKLNLQLGNSSATTEEMWNVLEKVHLSEKVKLLGGLNSYINYNGNNLSGGENQRLSLARAMLSKHPILLLDEPSSAMDVSLEKDIFKEILKLNKTSFIVVHKLKAIPDKSKILFIRNKTEYIIDTLENLITNDLEFQKLYYINEKSI